MAQLRRTDPSYGPHAQRRCRGDEQLVESKGFCRKFAFETICAMVSPDDLPCPERESDDGDQLHGVPFSTRCSSPGRALVGGVSLKLSPCRSTAGSAGS